VTAALRVHFVSDVGLQRERNEDYGAVHVPEGGNRGAILAIADGMGGIGNGDVASRVAVTAAVETLRASEGSVLEAMRSALEEANRAVYSEKMRDPANGPMGTTCTLAVIQDRDVFLAHIGDTRAYVVGNESVRQLTRDHSLVAGLVERHQLTPDEAKVDPRRNIVTRGLGIESSVVVDTLKLEEPLEPSDTLVLCTDGLHSQITDEELATMSRGHDLEHAGESLIRLANSRGGPDNISVILARLQSSQAGATSTVTLDRRHVSGHRGQGGPASREEPALVASTIVSRSGAGWKLVLALLALAASCALLWVLAKNLRESAARLDPSTGSVSPMRVELTV
jgi:PPM family protein phosphatase